MPPLPSQPNVLKVQYLLDVGEDVHAICRLFLKYSGSAPTDASCVTIATAIGASFTTNLIPHLNAANKITGVVVTDLSSPTSGFGEALSTVTGGAGGAPLSAGAAVIMNLQIARRYRGGKPRIYWPFLSASDLSDPQTWLTASLTSLHTGMQQHITDILALTTGGIVISALVNVSFYQGFTPVQNPITLRWRNVNKPRTVAIAPDAALNFSFNPRVGSQRRRNLHST